MAQRGVTISPQWILSAPFCYSHLPSPSVWSPSPQDTVFINCSCVDSPQAPKNLFLLGLLPVGCSSYQDSAVNVSSSQLEALSRYLHLPQCGVLSGLHCGSLIHCGPLELLICFSALPPSLPLVFTQLFLTYFSNSLLLKLLCSIFWPFLTAFPKMSLFSCGAQLWDLALPCSEFSTQQPWASSQMPPLKPLPSLPKCRHVNSTHISKTFFL